MIEYIDKASYKALKNKNMEPYYINESNVTDMFGDKNKHRYFK